MAGKNFPKPDFRQSRIAAGAGLNSEKLAVYREDEKQIIFIQTAGREQVFVVSKRTGKVQWS